MLEIWYFFFDNLGHFIFFLENFLFNLSIFISLENFFILPEFSNFLDESFIFFSKNFLHIFDHFNKLKIFIDYLCFFHFFGFLDNSSFYYNDFFLSKSYDNFWSDFTFGFFSIFFDYFFSFFFFNFENLSVDSTTSFIDSFSQDNAILDQLANQEQFFWSSAVDKQKKTIFFDFSDAFFDESIFWNVSSVFNFFYENFIYCSDHVSFFSNKNSLVLYKEPLSLDTFNFFYLDDFKSIFLNNIDLNFFSLVRAKGLTLNDPSVSFFIHNPIDNIQVLKKFLFFSKGLNFEEFKNSATFVKFLKKFFYAVKGLVVAKDYSSICIKANEIANTLINTDSKQNDLNNINIKSSFDFLKLGLFRLYLEKLSLNFLKEFDAYLFENNINFYDLKFNDSWGFYYFYKFFEYIFLNSKNLTDLEFWEYVFGSFFNSTFLKTINNYTDYHQKISTLIPKFFLVIKDFSEFYFNFQVPFEKIVYPFFMEHENFLKYSQTIKNLLLVVDHFFKRQELHSIIKFKNLELKDMVHKDKVIEYVFRKNKVHVNFLKKAAKNLSFVKLSFQLFKAAYAKIDMISLNHQISSTVNAGQDFHTKLTNYLSIIYQYVFDFLDICIALQKMEFGIDNFNKSFNSFFYVDFYDLIMDLMATHIIDIPTFIYKFNEKFIVDSAKFADFKENAAKVIDNYYILITAVVDFFHRDASAFPLVSQLISSRISDFLNAVQKLLSLLTNDNFILNLDFFSRKFFLLFGWNKRFFKWLSARKIGLFI